jgi:hypothetical protein
MSGRVARSVLPLGGAACIARVVAVENRAEIPYVPS